MPGALGYLQFHPVASVDRHIVRALQKAADRLRWEITGVDVSLGVREAYTAESYGEMEKQILPSGYRALPPTLSETPSQTGCGVEPRL